MTSIEERMRVQELLDEQQAEIDELYRQSQGLVCPPRNGGCNQGRTCPHADDDFRSVEGMILWICVTMIGAAVFGWVMF